MLTSSIQFYESVLISTALTYNKHFMLNVEPSADRAEGQTCQIVLKRRPKDAVGKVWSPCVKLPIWSRAPGPDLIIEMVVREWSEKLICITCQLFNQEHSIPTTYSEIRHISKTDQLVELNHYNPVDLTSDFAKIRGETSDATPSVCCSLLIARTVRWRIQC